MGKLDLLQIKSNKSQFKKLSAALLLGVCLLGTSCKEGEPLVAIITPPSPTPSPVEPGPDTSHWKALDVSDVSFLWPRLRGQDFFSLQPIVGDSTEASLVPITNNQNPVDTLIDFSLGKAPGGGTNVALPNTLTGRRDLISAPTESWRPFRSEDVRVVSFRVDDCGDALRQTATTGIIDRWVMNQQGVRFHRSISEQCKVSIRLVAQPISGDNAIHLIYNYEDTTILTEVMDDLQKIKADSPIITDGLPLGVHPALLAEGGNGPFSTKLKEFIRKYAKPEKLDVIAFLSTNEASGGGLWNFFEAVADRDAQGRTNWQVHNLHALDGSPLSQGFTGQDSDPVRPGPPELANSFSQAAMEENFNPNFSFAPGTDCKSCHIATQLVAGIARSNSQQFEPFFRSANTLINQPGITNFPDSRAIPTEQRNFRAFGWFENRPTVIAWVAQKSGSVAASLNKQFLGRDNGPGAQCSSRQHIVMRCLLQNARQNSRCIESICDQAE